MSAALPLSVVVGPTASGKSEWAQRLAEKIHGEILNCDSQQFYRGLDVGTGKLPPEQRRVPHWLFDLCEPGEWMTAGQFARLADDKITELRGRGVTPILVGGTGLYLRALLEGFDDLPPRDPKIREALSQRLATEGSEPLHRELASVDPELANRVAAQDASRLVRFLEIYQQTGQAPSTLFQKKPGAGLRFPVEVTWLTPPRDWLRDRIAGRVGEMLEQGWVAEVESLIAAGQHPRTWSNKPIGYGEVADFLQSMLSFEEMREQIVKKTRQYAKRQETFFRALFRNPSYQSDGNRLVQVGDFFS